MGNASSEVPVNQNCFSTISKRIVQDHNEEGEQQLQMGHHLICLCRVWCLGFLWGGLLGFFPIDTH